MDQRISEKKHQRREKKDEEIDKKRRRKGEKSSERSRKRRRSRSRSRSRDHSKSRKKSNKKETNKKRRGSSKSSKRSSSGSSDSRSSSSSGSSGTSSSSNSSRSSSREEKKREKYSPPRKNQPFDRKGGRAERPRENRRRPSGFIVGHDQRVGPRSRNLRPSYKPKFSVNTSILKNIISTQKKINHRMDKEEEIRATKKLQKLEGPSARVKLPHKISQKTILKKSIF